jgi:ATP-binding cassette, sub-family E, member 1
MNKFLASLEITFRRDPTNFRPRVNKLNSVKDKEQKGSCLADPYGHPDSLCSASGNYFFLEE